MLRAVVSAVDVVPDVAVYTLIGGMVYFSVCCIVLAGAQAVL
jgi:hypothetical protein